MIKATGIIKSFGQLRVLNGISLQANEGEIVSIVGASGAGKSTLLHIIGTLDKADQGEIYFNDTEIGKMNSENLAHFRNRNIGFVFQFHHLLPEFTAIENICMPAFISGESYKEAIKKGEQLLELMNLTDRKNHKPSEISGGEQQRIAVARALINNPEIVLADEPSGNLDSDNSKDLHQLFFNLRDELGQTFIIATHNEQLADMADRKLQMQDGNII